MSIAVAGEARRSGAIDISVKKRVRRGFRFAEVRARAALQDVQNIFRYGLDAPLFAERIWIDPAAISNAVRGIGAAVSGRILPGDWDLEWFAVEDTKKMRFCRLRWEQDLPWAETGAYEDMLHMIAERGSIDGCRVLSEVIARYESLDNLFEQIRREGRLRRADELTARSFREQGGIRVHVDRHGGLLFGNRGNHRFAMARILGLSCIPAMIGVVHADAVGRWRTASGICEAPVSRQGSRG